jgi:hypothetical protein
MRGSWSRKSVFSLSCSVAVLPQYGHQWARGKSLGDLPPKSDPADLARFLSVLIYGMAVQSAGGASRKELLKVAEIALNQWPER